MKTKKAIYVSLLLIILPLLNSCIGLSVNIQMNKDGSGRLAMEYRISKMINNLGALDGNESMPTIPVGKTDWERTVNRIQGAKLVSFSSVEEKQDTVIKAVIDFQDDQALLALLDPIGKNTSISRQDQSGKLDIVLLDDSVDYADYDEEILDMMRIFFAGYDISISFSGHRNLTLAVTDYNGNVIPPQANAKTVLSGRKVSYSIGIMDLLDIKKGLGLRFVW
jgi:hypothetical protein